LHTGIVDFLVQRGRFDFEITKRQISLIPIQIFNGVFVFYATWESKSGPRHLHYRISIASPESAITVDFQPSESENFFL
jgi:hypothetical protein